ncbi:B-type flagellin [Pseudoalteromonas sp. 3J6]|jgi:flagellin|uniref:flagellin n=1 Tax=unclassified Pseudoalteromonas TaxID=194690 RepID=UPI00110A7D4B|nr:MULTISPECIES: flagellin [unclassified Pseudoalteromonas]NWL17016.1 flagellin [Pseudoalteromonas sp. Scap03]QLE82114.1 flagellin [Pseudoalteromonas sp. Scap25]QLE90057.1 flagellin [Pseudoalteromonas sp. Scap06]TMP72585.1 flagellin [Pseudoalteromonas sp. S1609]CAD2225380.1 B-type flagellin [Pseudoalteromonas sp. 3J6]
MALSVNTNVASINAQRNLSKSSDALGTSMQRLSSGMKINSAKDDAAGLQIANRLSSQINGLGVAQRNANDGISMSQTAEGAMTESSNILQRMRDLALQSANGSNDADARAALQKEVGALQQELTRIAETTKFGGTSLLDGSFGTKQFQVGSNANETINVSLRDVSADAIGANEIKGAATSTVSALGDVQTVNLAGNIVTSADTLSINGTDVSVGANQGAATIADTINSSGSGVNAEAKLETTIGAIKAGSSSVIEIKKGATAVDSYDLGDFGGDMARLANEMQADGYDAVFDEAKDEITFKATNIDGIDVTGAGDTSAFTIGGQAVASTAGSLSVSAELNLSSADKIGISGTSANELFGKGAAGADIASTGGTSELTSVESVDISGATSAGAQDAIKAIDAALAQIDAQRADLGAVQNRFGFTIANLSNVSENVSASKSRIQDTDYAAETAKLTKNQIMQQAGTTILAQSNQLPQAALSLLG